MTVTWSKFLSFMLYLDQNSPFLRRKERAEYICDSPAMRMVKLVLEPLDTTRWEILEAPAHLQCEEIRDRVYALLGFAKTGVGAIEPDYDMSLSVLLNKILEEEHRSHRPSGPREISRQCHVLQGIFGVQPETMSFLMTLQVFILFTDLSICLSTLTDSTALRLLSYGQLNTNTSVCGSRYWNTAIRKSHTCYSLDM
jgi:hypothetical protein